MYDKLRVPLDGSSLAEEALPHVESLALKYGSEVILFEAVQPIAAAEQYSDSASSIHIYEQLVRDSQKNAKNYLAQAAAALEAKGVNVVREDVKMGEPAELIVESAKAANADLIIMTSHGRSGIKRWFYGSVAETVLRHSSIPVMLVRCAGACEP